VGKINGKVIIDSITFILLQLRDVEETICMLSSCLDLGLRPFSVKEL